jgi:hypothetical protein
MATDLGPIKQAVMATTLALKSALHYMKALVAQLESEFNKLYKSNAELTKGADSKLSAQEKEKEDHSIEEPEVKSPGPRKTR